MPKRIGGDSLGHHGRLHIKCQEYLYITLPFVISVFVSHFYNMTPFCTYAHGILLLLTLWLGLSTFLPAIVQFLLKCIFNDAPPPWA